MLRSYAQDAGFMYRCCGRRMTGHVLVSLTWCRSYHHHNRDTFYSSQPVGLRALGCMHTQGQDNIELLKHCTAPAWASLLHLLTVSERQLAIESGYACVAFLTPTMRSKPRQALCLGGPKSSQMLGRLVAIA